MIKKYYINIKWNPKKDTVKELYELLQKIKNDSYDLTFLPAAKDYEKFVHDLYLFRWEEVPGNDSVKLIEFLMQNFNIGWIEAAKISKNDDGKTIRITNDTNFLSLALNNEKNTVNIEIDDGRTDKFIVKMENGELNIYDDYF